MKIILTVRELGVSPTCSTPWICSFVVLTTVWYGYPSFVDIFSARGCFSALENLLCRVKRYFKEDKHEVFHIWSHCGEWVLYLLWVRFHAVQFGQYFSKRLLCVRVWLHADMGVVIFSCYWAYLGYYWFSVLIVQ